MSRRQSRYSRLFLMFAMLSLLLPPACQSTLAEQKPSGRPNIILILMDDMGFADLGMMGSMIQTPHIDQLAKNGLFYHQFYNNGRCCPSRASLLTGRHAHAAGMGWMTVSDLGHPGYRGDLNQQSITIAQALQKNSYACYMAGKWHLTHRAYMQEGGSQHNWPIQRGFDRFYGHLSGAGGYFDMPTMLSDNHWIDSLPSDFYLTQAVSDSSIQFVSSHLAQNQDQPFFLYLAYYAPHRPLQALETDIARYRGKFMLGWDSLRLQKWKRMRALGVLDSSCRVSPRDPQVPPWESLSEEEKRTEDARMAIYAAQIDRADQGIGRLLEVLEAHGALDNSLIFFLSDNGGENYDPGPPLNMGDLDTLGIQKATNHGYGRPWANASNSPFRYFKTQVHEGGISTPLIVHWPAHILTAGNMVQQIGHVIDIFPTILEATHTAYPDRIKGQSTHPLHGKSLFPTFRGNTFDRGPLFFEHNTNRAIRDGNFKLVALSNPRQPDSIHWELYDMASDRSETQNLAGKFPQKVNELSKKWDLWATENQVYPLDSRNWGEKIRANQLKGTNKD